jgi:hypothetical protein
MPEFLGSGSQILFSLLGKYVFLSLKTLFKYFLTDESQKKS